MSIRDNEVIDFSLAGSGRIDGFSRFNPLHYGGKLFQQYLVYCYIRVEQDRLDWYRGHQKEIKAEQYKVIHDYLASTADEAGVEVGRNVILPSTFEGSPRNCQQGTIRFCSICYS